MEIAPSPFIALANTEYFRFEEDFVEENVRCIPMVVRFKMDDACIKLKLSEWSKFSVEERIELAVKPCNTTNEIAAYAAYLVQLIKKYTRNEPSVLEPNPAPDWANTNSFPASMQERLDELGLNITVDQWAALTNLQRFAILKLCKSGHEHKNLPKALKEFDLIV
ncbi:MAG: nitrate reductase associated protein [Bacteroidota bacterium]